MTVEKTVTKEKPAQESTQESGGVDGTAGGGGSITVPDVVGKDHQLAQDEMQAAGLYALDEKDCTGQDRLLIYDRNWTVVKQSPPAGTKASPDQTITLCSKKDGE